MKKFLTIVFIGFIALSCCFANGEKPNPGEPEPDIPIVPEAPALPDMSNWLSSSVEFVLDSGPDKSSYDIGFSAIPVTQWSTKPSRISEVSLKTEILDDGSVKASNGTPVYIYWRLNTFDGVKIVLTMNGKLKQSGQSAGNKIAWSISWPGDNNTPIVISQPNKAQVVCDIPKSVIMQSIGGCVPLSIETKSLYGHDVSSPYSANMTLTISVN